MSWYPPPTISNGQGSCENVSYAICEQQRCRSACASALSKVSRFYLVSVAEQAGLNLNLTWSKLPEDTFSRDVAQMEEVET